MKRGGPLTRTPPARSSALGKPSAPPKPRPVAPCTPEQRMSVAHRICLVCGRDFVDPAHLISRRMCPEGADHVLAVVPLCRPCHREYDGGTLDILPYLEPLFRDELAFAVKRFGLISTLERVTNTRWAPGRMEAA